MFKHIFKSLHPKSEQQLFGFPAQDSPTGIHEAVGIGVGGGGTGGEEGGGGLAIVAI